MKALERVTYEFRNQISNRNRRFRIINILISHRNRKILDLPVRWTGKTEDFLTLIQGKVHCLRKRMSKIVESLGLLNSRQSITATANNEVPYARLLDSPSRVSKGKDQLDTKLSPTPSIKHEYGSYTPKALRIPAPKTSSSDSKLTVDYFQGSEHSVEP